jgi:hypothetical protein
MPIPSSHARLSLLFFASFQFPRQLREVILHLVVIPIFSSAKYAIPFSFSYSFLFLL